MTHRNRQPLYREDGKQQCSICREIFPATLEFFNGDKTRKSGLQRLCKPCRDSRRRNWQANNRQKTRDSANARTKTIRKEVLEHYSNGSPICKCCGETEIKFLCIDHVDGGGCKHRKQLSITSGTHFYAWLRRENFPIGFQVLCHNCNMAKGFYGNCPHKEK